MKIFSKKAMALSEESECYAAAQIRGPGSSGCSLSTQSLSSTAFTRSPELASVCSVEGGLHPEDYSWTSFLPNCFTGMGAFRPPKTPPEVDANNTIDSKVSSDVSTKLHEGVSEKPSAGDAHAPNPVNAVVFDIKRQRPNGLPWSSLPLFVFPHQFWRGVKSYPYADIDSSFSHEEVIN